jgi:hypothetical protein
MILHRLRSTVFYGTQYDTYDRLKNVFSSSENGSGSGSSGGVAFLVELERF